MLAWTLLRSSCFATFDGAATSLDWPAMAVLPPAAARPDGQTVVHATLSDRHPVGVCLITALHVDLSHCGQMFLA
jgi:hypothetical protein